MNLDEIVRQLSVAVEELVQYSTPKEKTKKTYDYDGLYTLARKNPFHNHVLCNADEMIRDIYITALLAVISGEMEDEGKEWQLLMIGRIIAAFNKEIPLEKYMVKQVKMDGSFWDDFAGFLTGDFANSFVVDALLVTYLLKDTSDARSKNAADVFQLLGLGKMMIQRLAVTAKAILKQDFAEMLDAVDDSIDFNYFLGYFSGIQIGYISTDLFQCKQIRGKVAIVNGKFENIKETINLDDFMAEEITFIRCSFKRIRGFTAVNKKTTFVKCVFESNLIDLSQRKALIGHTFWGKGIDEITEKNYVFLSGGNISIIKSKFTHCTVSKCLVEIDNGTLEGCVFESCTGIELPCTYLVRLDGGSITDCTFDKCTMETDRESRSTTTGCLVYMAGGEVRNCIFTDCMAKGNTSYGGCARYIMLILRAYNARVKDCSFKKCRNDSANSGNKVVTSYILGMNNNSREDGNRFEECTSYHYKYGDRLASHDTGIV